MADINRQFNEIYRRLSKLERHTPRDPDFIHFSWWGPLIEEESGERQIRYSGYVSTIVARLTTPSEDDTLFKIKFSGDDLPLFTNIFTIPGGESVLAVEGYESISPFLIANREDPALSDYLTTVIVTAPEGAETLEIDVGMWHPSI